LFCFDVTAHAPKPSAEENRENDILYISSPEAVVFVVWGIGGDGSKLVDALDLFLDGSFGSNEDRSNCDC
tara:strand:- start:194 stop:403 length:210 start_codon:yes stop_codon:yes gene_type:complete